MKRLVFFFCVSLALSLSTAGILWAEDGELKDTPYFSAMPSYYVGDAQDREFDSYGFYDGTKTVTVEGKYWKKQYWLKEGARQASELQIIRNYGNALKKVGGKVLVEGSCSDCDVHGCGGNIMTGKFTKGSSELWVEVIPCNDGSDYTLVLIEKGAMKQDVTAGDMLQALNSEGHIALYINFDTGKASIKDESRTIINEVAGMLRNNPGLNLSVEGHTDNEGQSKSNMTLAEARARAVVAAIVQQGIDGKRLSAAGFGQSKPIADNSTEEGRAKNRRVELVKK